MYITRGPRRSGIYSKNRVNPCRPGFGASCAFCCGSHNYKVPPEQIEEIFTIRGKDVSAGAGKHPEDSSGDKLVAEGMQCPHVGFSGDEPGIVCCLVYSDEKNSAGLNSFFNGTCKNFFCAAWDELTDRQVLFAAELMKDWYYYSLLINSVEALTGLYAEYEHAGDVPPDRLSELKLELEQSLLEEDLI